MGKPNVKLKSNLENEMKVIVVAALLSSLATPALAKTHKEAFAVPCSTLWPAVKDTLRNSGKYGIISIVNEELTASYNIGGSLTGKRINTVLLNPSGSGCEMQIQTAFSGLVNNDAGDFKKRIDESLAKLNATPPNSAPADPKTRKPVS
jgi:hypothetical protein